MTSAEPVIVAGHYVGSPILTASKSVQLGSLPMCVVDILDRISGVSPGLNDLPATVAVEIHLLTVRVHRDSESLVRSICFADLRTTTSKVA